MPAAHVQGTTGKGATATVTTAAFPGATTASNCIVVAIADDSGISGQISSVADSKGNAYTQLMQTPLTSTLTVFYAVNIAGGTGHTITVNWSLANGSNLAVVAQEFSGIVKTTPAFDFAQTNTGGTDTAATSGASSPSTQNDELILGFCATAGAAITFTAGSGYSNVISSAQVDTNVAMESKVVSTTGAQTATFTLSAARDWVTGVSGFLAAAPPPPPAKVPGAFLPFFI